MNSSKNFEKKNRMGGPKEALGLLCLFIKDVCMPSSLIGSISHLVIRYGGKSKYILVPIVVCGGIIYLFRKGGYWLEHSSRGSVITSFMSYILGFFLSWFICNIPRFYRITWRCLYAIKDVELD